MRRTHESSGGHRRTHGGGHMEEDTQKRTHGRGHSSGRKNGSFNDSILNSTEKFQRTDSDHH